MDTQALISLDLIDPNPYQPRATEDAVAVAEIAESIRRNGLMQIPTARPVNGRYQLAFGHTRKAAFKLLQEETMPLIIRELDDLQMFELGVSENIKRRDLNPIEQAESMRRYMQEFKKNSVETGEFFNVSPEKVRNAIRLLNLPETLQSGVADGTITQNNARRLLTLQRVAPQEVTSVAKQLKGDADPDRIISKTLTDTGRSVEMWQRWQNGEPRAGNHLWVLRQDAANFPSKYLPELRAAEVAKSLDMEYTAELRAKIEDYIETVKRSPEFVSQFAEQRPEEAALMERIAHLVNPPSCSACPMYAKVDGSHFCTIRLCHSRKAKAWEENVIQTASKKMGIAIYDAKTDGKDSAYLSSYDKPDEKLFTDRNPDLRIKKGTNWAQHFEGLPDGYSVILVGATLKKRRAANKNDSVSRDNSEYYAEQKRLAAMRKAHEVAIYDFLWNVATPAFVPVFNGLTALGFMETLADRFVRGVPAEEPDKKKATKAERVTFYQRSVLFSMFDDDLWDIKQKKKPVTALAKHLQGVATAWGVKLPKNWMELAAEADKAIRVSVETAEKE